MAQSRYWTAAPVWAVYVAGFVPAAYYWAAALTGNLGPDPLRGLENGLGEWALRYLILGLAITPLLRFGRINLVRYRRAVGLTAFFYVVMHLVTYVALDQAFRWAAIGADIVKRPYITVGMAAFVMLLPLAVTSNDLSIRRLGTAAWRNLHKLVYPAALLAALHYILLVKAWPLQPIVYLGLVVALLAVRTVRRRRRGRTGGALRAAG